MSKNGEEKYRTKKDPTTTLSKIYNEQLRTKTAEVHGKKAQNFSQD
jgi:hypothetical protein